MNTLHIYIQEDALTFSAARDQIRCLLEKEEHPSSIIVHIPAGIYSAADFRFTAADCADDCMIEYIAEGPVMVHGGITIPSEDWEIPDSAMAERFSEDIRANIRMISLRNYGLTDADWGTLPAIGAYETSRKYDDASRHCGCEVYCGNRRMHIARYPNSGFSRLQAVIDVGDCHEFPEQNYFYEWDNRHNHRGGSYVIHPSDNERMKQWKDPSTAWMFGYFYHDWADASTPIQSIDTEHRIVNPRYVAYYGAKAGALYYFYNVPEELDIPGEWFLDRSTGCLYFYPYPGSCHLDFAFNDHSLISGHDVQNLTFRGLTLTCTVGDGIHITGHHIHLQDIHIFNIGGSGVVFEGSDCLIDDCDISHTGRGGIILQGGDRSTLTPAHNRACRNYIHDFSEVYLTYQPGIKLEGVGNHCDHNEICNSPHMAIGYSGNEHLIEYNDIHHVVLQSSDAGAIYSGYDWAAHGTIIRYNLLRHIGDGEFTPDGIYWDDGLSGQTAYCNLLIDVRKHSFLVGGGRENHVERNVIINSGSWPLHYDDRNRDGFLHDGWAKAAVNHPDAPHWKKLREIPYTTPIWADKYPLLAAVKTDFDTDPDDPDFPVNPSYSTVCNNIIIDSRAKDTGYCIGISDSVFQYSTVQDNPVFSSPEEALWNPDTMSFAKESPVFHKISGFSNIPVDQIGRHPCM